MGKRVESVVCNGITFRRYPDSERASDRYYFRPHAGHIRNGIEALHREVWKSVHGPIPEGHHIHHVDHDAGNNDPSNLVCIPDAEHRAHHGDDPLSDAQRAHLDRVRGLAAEWHRSPEGRAWHVEHGRRTYADRRPEPFECQQCGRTYESRNRGDGTRFCSNKCKAAWRRASGVDDVQRICERCSAEFTINKYKRTRYCSQSCGARSRRGA